MTKTGENRGVAGAREKFGVLLFDDPERPEAGIISTGTRESLRRIEGTHQVPRDTLWWSNVPLGTLSRLSGASWIRSENYIGPKMKNVLNEWGIGLWRGRFSHEANLKSAALLATLFQNVMLLASGLIRRTLKERDQPPGNELDWFRQNYLRGDLAELLPRLELPEGNIISILRPEQAFLTYSKTSAGFQPAHMRLSVFVPRGTHAARMLETTIPKGGFSFVKPETLEKSPKLLTGLLEEKTPFLAEIVIKSFNSPDDESVFAFNSTLKKGVNIRRSWVTDIEYESLVRIAEIEVRSLYVANGKQGYEDILPPSYIRFIKDRTLTGYSWSAGVLAENIWKSGLTKPASMNPDMISGRRGLEKPAATILEAWLRGRDKALTTDVALHMASKGSYVISGYGGGAVHMSCMPQQIDDLILDAVQASIPEVASLPACLHVPENFPFENRIRWGGDIHDNVVANLVLNRQLSALRKLDLLSVRPHKERESIIMATKKSAKENMEKEKRMYEQSRGK